MGRDDLHIGHYVSGAGHLTLIGWLLLGNIFTSEPPPFEMTEVSVISGAEFDALVAAQRAPEQVTEVAQPEAPEAPTEEPQAPAPVETPPEQDVAQPTPAPTPPPAEDPVPQVSEPEALPPQSEVDDTAPPDLAEPVGEEAVLVPNVAPEAAPRPVDRVAPEAVAEPDPEATPDPVEQEAVVPDEAEAAEVEQEPQEPQEATAPEEATTEIVTEATKAPAASPRPPGRRPAPPPPQVAEAEPEPETPASAPDTPTEEPAPEAPAEEPTEPSVDEDAIAAAIAAAQEATEAPAAAAPSGPPLSSGEKESLRVAVSSCWNVGSLSSEALNTTVTVGVNMAQDGTPVVSSIQMLGSEGGSDAAARQAFEAARRAIIRCGSSGYNLPAEKYSQWQQIEMTFNPEGMRLR